MLLSVTTNFIAYSSLKMGAQGFAAVDGQILSVTLLATAGAESAIGLAILVLIYRRYMSIDTVNLTKLRG